MVVTESEEPQHLKLWPTLAKDHLLLNLKEDTQSFTVEIRNLMGQLVVSEKGLITHIGIAHLISGHYVLNVLVDGNRYSERFIKVD